MTTRTHPSAATGRRADTAAVYRPLFSAPADPTTTDAITGDGAAAPVAPVTAMPARVEPRPRHRRADPQGHVLRELTGICRARRNRVD